MSELGFGLLRPTQVINFPKSKSFGLQPQPAEFPESRTGSVEMKHELALLR